MRNKAIQALLNNLRSSLEKGQNDKKLVALMLYDILVWLSENNTDENCKTVDLAMFSIIGETDLSWLPEDLRQILEDMGSILHDTHSEPEIAQMFCSTPSQLLERIKVIKDGLK